MPAELHPIARARLPERFSLGPHQIDLAAHRVICGEDETRLTPKATGVLRVLAEHAGRAVRRDELLEKVWPGAWPTDDVLSHAVTELRRALNDAPRDSQVIETIPKVGYRLLPSPGPAAASSQTDPASGAPAGSRAAAAAGAGVAGLALGALAMFWLGPDRAAKAPPQPPAPLSAAVPLTVDPGQERMPAVSDDGRQIVYAGQAGFGASYDLFIRSSAADQAIRFTATDEANELVPVWSPDGSEVAFFRFSRAGCELIIKPVVGGFERRLSRCQPSAVTYIDWSPDGQYLAVTGPIEANEVGGIVLLDVKTGQLVKPEYYKSASEHDLQPQFSPSGDWIMFRRGAYPRSDLFMMRLDGSNLTRLTGFGSQILGFDWLPDERHAWFCSDHGGRNALWQLDVRKRDAKLIEIGCPYMLSVARSASVMAYQHVTVDPSVIEVTLGDGVVNATPRFLSTRIDAEPTYDPQARRVAFVSDRTGDNQLWIGDLESEEVFQLTRHQGMNLSQPRWTPDASSLYYIGRGLSGEAIYRVAVESGIVERVSGAGERVRALGLSRDGQRIYFASNASGDWQIWGMDPGGGNRRQITTHGGTMPVDPLGDGWVYFTKLSQFGLWRIPLDGGSEELVTHLLEFYNQDSWVLNEQGIYLSLISDNRPSSIHLIPWAADGPPRLVAPGSGGTDLISLKDVSADGRRLLLVRSHTSQQDIMIARDW